MRQAVALHQDRRFDDAIAVYWRILLMYPDNADALTYFGCALLEIGKAIEAVDRLHEAVAAGLGIGVVTESELGQDDRLVTCRLSDVSLEAREYVVCLKERRAVRTVQAFFDLADEDRTSRRTANRSPWISRPRPCC